MSGFRESEVYLAVKTYPFELSTRVNAAAPEILSKLIFDYNETSTRNKLSSHSITCRFNLFNLIAMKESDDKSNSGSNSDSDGHLFPDPQLTQQQLKDSKDLLQSVFDTSLIQMSVMKAVRDENGKHNRLPDSIDKPGTGT